MRQELARVEADVALCTRCFGMEPRWPVRFGRPDGRARVLILGERAPRALLEAELRLGLDAPDAVSAALRSMLQLAGIPAGEVVVGAALLCGARARALEEAVPLSLRTAACADHVRELVRATDARLVVPLGAVALRSLSLAFPEHAAIAGWRFPDAVGRTVTADGRRFHPLYHVSARVRHARDADEQREDWLRLGRVWKEVRGDGPGGD